MGVGLAYHLGKEGWGADTVLLEKAELTSARLGTQQVKSRIQPQALALGNVWITTLICILGPWKKKQVSLSLARLRVLPLGLYRR